MCNVAFLVCFYRLPSAAARNTLVIPRKYLASICTTITYACAPYLLYYILLQSTLSGIAVCCLLHTLSLRV